MEKIIYEEKECKVIATENEWGWCYYKERRVWKPYNTWLLINDNGFLHWVSMTDCKGIE